MEISNFFPKMQGLVLLYQSEGRFKEAEELSLDMVEKIKNVSTSEGFDPQGSDMVIANQLLAMAYQNQQNWEAATEKSSSVLEAKMRMLGADAELTLESRMDLARVLVFQGRRNSAKQLEDEVTEVRQKRTLAEITHWTDKVEILPSVGEPSETRPQRSKYVRKWPNPESSDSERIREVIRVSKLISGARARMAIEHSNITLPGFGPLPPTQSDDTKCVIQYTPLAETKSEIRLLIVYPGTFESTNCCKLTHAYLNEDPSYMALSYCWSKTKEVNESSKAEIFLKNRAIKVTKSAETALRYLRNLKEDVVVWIDAICINQQDLSEKSSQVRMMGKIYDHGK